MNKKHIEEVKKLLMGWNPLGEKANQIADLENYETEAIDILFYIDKKSSSDYINKIMVRIILEAFGVGLDLNKTIKYAEKIKSIINKKQNITA